MSTSQGKHPTPGRLSCLQCRGTSHGGTPDISGGSSRTVSDSNSPHTSTSQHHTFSLLHTIWCFSCGFLSPPSPFHSFYLLCAAVPGSIPQEPVSSYSRSIPPAHFPLCNPVFPPQHSEPPPTPSSSHLLSHITSLSLSCNSRLHHSTFSVCY